MPRLSLYWPRDLDGYHLEPFSSSKAKTAAAGVAEIKEPRRAFQLQAVIPSRKPTILSSVVKAPSVVRNGGRLDTTVDRMQVHALYQILADTSPTAKGALDFVSKYGFLRSQDSFESVDDICSAITSVRSLIKRKQARDWRSLQRWIDNNPNLIRLTAQLLPGDPPELFFGPVTLQDAIYLQFFYDLPIGAQLRRCKRSGCDNWFKFGPGTGRRNTAQYCSPRCQKADAYANSKGA